jgi:formylglycine-generating enzyme required for sulfatase activity
MAAIPKDRGAASFCLDLSEVTVSDFAGCVTRSTCTEPKPYDATIRLDRYRAFCNWHHPEDRAQHPVNCVSYDQARVYCASREARLPTDVEWTIAASNGGQSLYPWGPHPPDGSRVNGCGLECPPAVRRIADRADVVAQYPKSDGFPSTAPVGSFPRGDNRVGVHDLAGNVAEFVVPSAAPESTGDLTAGGGFLTQNARMMSARVQTRTAWSGATSPDLGFRCAADAR